jgi:WD40 repeat protein
LGVAFSPDGKLIASASFDGTSKLWEISNEKPIMTFIGHSDQVNAVAFSPDGEILASASGDKKIMLWKPSNEKPMGPPLEGHSDSVESLSFSQDGTWIISVSRDMTARIWSTIFRGQIKKYECHSKAWGVAFSPDGQLFATALETGALGIFEVITGHEQGQYNGHLGSALKVAFSPDGKFIASASSDKTVNVWEISNEKPKKPKMTLIGHSDQVYGVAFSPDGKILASASRDGTIKLWELGPTFETIISHSTYAQYWQSPNGVEYVVEGKQFALGRNTDPQ